MKEKHPLYQYLDDGVSFQSDTADIRCLYFPLCGTSSQDLKSSITPFLSGDIKIDKNRYFTRPVSREDLRQDVRNFFVFVPDRGVFSLTAGEPDSGAEITAGPFWHKLVRRHPSAGLDMEALNFIPVSGESVELMQVTVTNVSDKDITVHPTAAIPVFARALSNKHDHEHVTSLLNRIELSPHGVTVFPSMMFNEEGHKDNETAYFVLGKRNDGQAPLGVFPTIESFCGPKGKLSCPQAVTENRPVPDLPPASYQGQEAMGALQFTETVLAPQESATYCIALGIGKDGDAEKIFQSFDTAEKMNKAFEAHQAYWQNKIQSVTFQTGDQDFNSWMSWVTLQPVLRRIFGCSFLPDHDYGKGGKGWRDLWQDLLSLLLIEPETVKDTLINNCAGVRIDGSNATIIGSAPGEFIADRNTITRVWMDHGVWPLMTILLYIHQTGDFDILWEEQSYFRDPQMHRTFEKDIQWTPSYGNQLKTRDGGVYKGSLLEHLLLQNLVQFFNVGEHNHIRLESADWNDGLDMAFARGESVAFSSAYAGNLLEAADLLESLAEKTGMKTLEMLEEMTLLLDSVEGKGVDYDDADAKRALLFDKYFKAVHPEVSGKKIKVSVADVVKDLRQKGRWIFDHIRRTERRTDKDHAWFNGYYDNQGARLEGKKNNRMWMTLTGQVFPLMSGLVTSAEAEKVHQAVKAHLKDPVLGGYRLNTDFGLRNYLDLGRAFGFAYGTKENGAFFSHMTVMYAFALYKQGLVREGYDVLRSIYDMGVDTDKSRIYPGIPEYFDSQGLGLYHYLTGSASWFVLTQLTQVFGVRGHYGDLVIAPKLVKEEFGQGAVKVRCGFAGKNLTVEYLNKDRLDYGQYGIKAVNLDGQDVPFDAISSGEIKISRSFLESLSAASCLQVVLGSL